MKMRRPGLAVMALVLAAVLAPAQGPEVLVAEPAAAAVPAVAHGGTV